MNKCIYGIPYIRDEGRIEEKISKGRKALDSSSGSDFKRNGRNMLAGNLILWSVVVVVPSTTFGCEDWVLSEKNKINTVNSEKIALCLIFSFFYVKPRTQKQNSQ